MAVKTLDAYFGGINPKQLAEIAETTMQLDDVSSITPLDKQILIYNDGSLEYVPGYVDKIQDSVDGTTYVEALETQLDLASDGNINLALGGDVVITSTSGPSVSTLTSDIELNISSDADLVLSSLGNLKLGDYSYPQTGATNGQGLRIKSDLSGFEFYNPSTVNAGYDNTTSGLTATDVQGAIDEVEGRLDTTETKLATIETNAKDDQIASEVPFTNTTSGLTATDVQGAVDEVEGRLDTAETKLATVETNAKDDQIASEVPFTPITGITSTDVQNAFAEVIPSSEKGVANGVATLDGSTKVPASQLPDVLFGSVSYQGTWDADTNTPTLTDGTGNKGEYYVVNVAGTTSIDGVADWVIGDWAIYDGTNWGKVDNTDQVSSVFGRQGPVVATASDYDANQIDYDNTTSGMASTDVQNAIDTVEGRLDTAETKLSGIEDNAKDDQNAAEVSYDDTSSLLGATNVQLAIEVLDSTLDTAIKTSDSINLLDDVDTSTTAPNSGEALLWDGSNWVPGVSGDPARIEDSVDGTTYVQTLETQIDLASDGDINLSPSGKVAISTPGATKISSPNDLEVSSNTNVSVLATTGDIKFGDYIFPQTGGTDGQSIRMNVGSTGFEFYTPTDTDTNTFLGLLDTPGAFGSIGDAVRVAGDGSSLEFYTPTDTDTNTFLGLLDTPGAFGSIGDAVRVAGDGSSLEFYTPSATISSIDDINDVDTTTSAPNDGDALVWSASGGNWVPGAGGGGGGDPVANRLEDSVDGTTYVETQETQINMVSDGDILLTPEATAGKVKVGGPTGDAKITGPASQKVVIQSDLDLEMSSTSGSVKIGSYTYPQTGGIVSQSIRINGSGTGYEFFTPTDTNTFVGLLDTPGSLGTNGQFLRVNGAGNALEFFTFVDNNTDTFIGLTDTPGSFGSVGDSVRVASGGSTLEFYTPIDNNTDTFAGLLDTPVSYAGSGDYFVRVKSSVDGLEYVTIAIDDISDVDTTTTAPVAGDLLQFDGSNWVPVNGRLYAINNIAGTTLGRNLLPADSGAVFIFNDVLDCTLTLPEQATQILPLGFNIMVKNIGGGALTINIEGSDTIDGASSVASNQPSKYVSVILEDVTDPNVYSTAGDVT